MTPPRGSVRRQVRISRPPDEVWAFAGDPARIQEWWPGIESSVVDGTSRVITTGAGIPMPEEILTHDVLDLEDGTSLVVYSADADPSTMALVIAGAAGNALENLRRILEGEGT